MDTCPPQTWLLPIQEPMVPFPVAWLSTDPHGPGAGGVEVYGMLGQNGEKFLRAPLLLAFEKVVLAEMPEENLWSVKGPPNGGAWARNAAVPESMASRGLGSGGLSPLLQLLPEAAVHWLRPKPGVGRAASPPRHARKSLCNCLRSGLKDHT